MLTRLNPNEGFKGAEVRSVRVGFYNFIKLYMHKMPQKLKFKKDNNPHNVFKWFRLREH